MSAVPRPIPTPLDEAVMRHPSARSRGVRGLVERHPLHGRRRRAAPPPTVADLPEVDVALVMESTYPYLKGGVSAVVHDIVTANPAITFGIIHITWDRAAPHEVLYDVPPNVMWVHPMYLSMQEHRADFMALRPRDLHMNPAERSAESRRLFSVMDAVLEGRHEEFWELYDDAMNPVTRTYSMWALLSTAEFQKAAIERFLLVQMSLADLFWLLREFFSLSYALLNEVHPRAAVYHAHTTGYASMLSAAAARQHGGNFLLTEHNLYVRDTVNTLLGRNMALPVTTDDWRNFDVTETERAWMAWWIEMGRLCYPKADHLTYLYPDAVDEGRALGMALDDSRISIVPNGMVIQEFEDVYTKRLNAIERMRATGEREWQLAYIARIVPIKGLNELLDSCRMLLDRGVTNWHLDVLGPIDATVREYHDLCVRRVTELGLEEKVTFRGVLNVREVIGEFDALVLPSFNEGQPMVVLEAMTAAVPTIGTMVGGMPQLLADRLTHTTGRSWEAGGILVDPTDIPLGVADAIEGLLVDLDGYEQLARNARGRVEDFFQLHDAMARYYDLYRHLTRKEAAIRALLDLVEEQSGSLVDLRVDEPDEGVPPSLASSF
ncbi:MAG TPA: GT4 family glycosyltransferase PelF [Acidimicrobiales bacterium]